MTNGGDNKNAIEELLIPALRATMGDWVYYITFLSLENIADMVDVAEEIHESETLNELIQRSLSPRASDIAEYLRTQEQRFFNSLVIGVYGGEPQWYEIEVGPNPYLEQDELPENMEGAIGLLKLRGDEQLFAIDGQHRVVGIRQALEDDRDLGEEEVSAIFVGHSTDEEGMRRTRRLFSTLNRYAKPVSKRDIIALDEDDVVAIVTRRLVESHPLFDGRVSLNKTKAISSNDQKSFTSIVALYDVLNAVLRDQYYWNTFKKYRPGEDEIHAYEVQAREYWDAVIERYDALQDVCESDPADQVAGEYRNEEGGHLLFRPKGLLMHTRVVIWLRSGEGDKWIEPGQGRPLDEVLDEVAEVPATLDAYPWVGVIWDSGNNRIITGSENRNAAQRLYFYAAGGLLEQIGYTEAELRQELAGVMNRDPAEVELRRFV